MGKMEYLGDPDCHFWLTRSVARSLGLNLSEAMEAGLLHADRYAEMVARCRKCTHVGECQLWLAHSGSGATRAPAFCAHAQTLNALKEKQNEERNHENS